MRPTSNSTRPGERALRALLLLLLATLGSLAGKAIGSTTSGTNSLSATVVGNAGQPLEHAVVSLHTAQPASADPATMAIMDQRRSQFAPTVVAIQAGTSVSFPNQDDVRHHVYSFSHPNAFELKLYHGATGQYHRFEHPGVVVLGCNIHDGMVGYLRVVDTPHFATSSAEGLLTIDNAPPGNYTLQLWHPDLGMRLIQKPITLAAGKFSVRLKLEVADQAPAEPKAAHRLQSLFRD